MAIGLRRKVRLDSRRERQALTRRANGNEKRPERARRDQRMQAKLAEQLKSTGAQDLSADLQSWVACQLGKRCAQASAEELQGLL